tara:strand:- start:21771 stop:22109 length:339 start_codon:yes stop_codon:yes gene_type:complete
MFYYAYTEATDIYHDKIFDVERITKGTKAFTKMLVQTKESGKAATKDLESMAKGGSVSSSSGTFETLSGDVSKTKDAGSKVIETTQDEASGTIDRAKEAIQLWILKHRNAGN